MRVLAVDTSSQVLGVAALDDSGQWAEFNYNLGLRHASHLVPTIKDLLKFAGLDLKDINAYCVSIGPGSFTGLRIGLTAVKALAVAEKKKVVAVPSLDVLAYNMAPDSGRIGVIVDAKKDNVYACFYEYKNGEPKRISPYLLIGRHKIQETVKKYHACILLNDSMPRALNTARIGLKMFKLGKTVKNIDDLTPFYMYPKDVQCRK